MRCRCLLRNTRRGCKALESCLESCGNGAYVKVRGVEDVR